MLARSQNRKRDIAPNGGYSPAPVRIVSNTKKAQNYSNYFLKYRKAAPPETNPSQFTQAESGQGTVACPSPDNTLPAVRFVSKKHSLPINLVNLEAASVNNVSHRPMTRGVDL